MCWLDRKTDSRGRSADPRMPLRTRNCRRSDRFALSFCASIGHLAVSGERLLPGRERLPFLPADDLAVVPDALALVRLRLLARPDLGGELPDGLLVRPGHDDRRRV